MAIPPLFFVVLLLSAVCGYLLGSISFAVVVSRLLYGKDVRTLGSGNAGMTNVLRNFGKTGAALTLLGDALKGAAAVFLARGFCLWLLPGTDTLYGAYIGAIAVLLGHMFPIFFGFKGGKGIATSLGVILTLQPVLALSLLGIFLIVLAITKMVSLGSIIAISLYPLTTALWCVFVSGQNVWYSTICSAIFTLLILYMHRENFARIRSGTEYKFGQKKPAEQDAPTEE